MVDNIKKRLDFKYFSETEDKYHATQMLDCGNYSVASGIKSKFGNDLNIYNILAEDITMYMTIDNEMNIKFPSVNRFPNQYIKWNAYKNAALELLEQFLDEDKIVLINTLHHELKFLGYYNMPYDYTNGMPVHWITVIHHDAKNIYYVEHPDMINHAHYNYYKDNQSVGVIDKEYLKPLFEKYLVCITIDIDFGRLDLFDERLFSILKNYIDLFDKEKIIDGINYFYGIASLRKMAELCFTEIKSDKSTEKLINSIRKINLMRIYMKECLMKLAENKSDIIDITKEDIYNTFEPMIMALINIINVLTKRDMKKQILLDESMSGLFNGLITYEKKIAELISKIIEHECDFI